MALALTLVSCNSEKGQKFVDSINEAMLMPLTEATVSDIVVPVFLIVVVVNLITK